MWLLPLAFTLKLTLVLNDPSDNTQLYSLLHSNALNTLNTLNTFTASVDIIPQRSHTL